MRRNLSAAFERLATTEREFANSEFLAPVTRGQTISVRVAGIVLQMHAEPADFEGWGVFRPRDLNHAEFLRYPKMSERTQYLKLYPGVRLVLSGRRGDQWFGRTAGPGRVTLTGDVPVYLTTDVQVLDTVRTRFDGGSFWYDGKEPSKSRQGDYLRGALQTMAAPESLEFTGLDPVPRDLYRELYVLRQAEIAEANRDKTEDRLREALAHAGAALQGYRELSDAYTVDYTVDGNNHTSVVDKKDLNVQSAGICLSGGDRAFDLTSLVGVIREGEARHQIVRVGLFTGPHGDQINNEDDW